MGQGPGGGGLGSIMQFLTVVKDLAQTAGAVGGLVQMAGGKDERGGKMELPGAPAPPAARAEKPDLREFGPQPAALAPPTFLGLNSSLSPEQQRSRISTMALAGGDAGFRGQEAQDYYRNVAQRSLTDPAGGVLPGASVLPIERQYATQVLGKSFRGDSVENFLTQLLAP